MRIPSHDINSIERLMELGVDDDHGIRKSNGYYECIISDHAKNQLKAHHIVFETVIQDMESFYEARIKTDYARFMKELNQGSILAPKNFVSGTMGGFYTLEEIHQQMTRIAEYAGNAFLQKDTIGVSHENRPIIAWIFGKDSTAQKPRTLLTSLHHAREPGGATTLLYFLWDLFERAKQNDPEAQYLLNERTLVIVPCINPDGYAFNQQQRPEGGGLWRKNRKKLPNDVFGVDLNRNYGPETFWNANNGGSSTDPKNDTYRGEAPFSEPETQALRNLIDSYVFGCILNYHTYSNLLIYPFAALSQETKDSSTFRGFSADATRFNAYSAGRDLETVGYTTRGNSDDWAYHAHDALAFTPEVGEITDGFWPSPLRIIPHAQENLHMNYQALWSSGSNLCIRLAEVKIDSLQDPMKANGSLEIDVQNIGRLNLEEPSSVIVQSLREDVTLKDSIITIPGIASGERIKRFLTYEVKNNYRNGDPARFLVTRVQHGISRTDTAIVALYHPTVFSIFTKASDTLSFKRNEWSATTLSDGQVMLADSPGRQYKQELKKYAEYTNDIDLNVVRQASFEFETRWNMEPM
ncbi:MAG: M14 family metallopeptidase, partial [Ignavibacteria bacterium]